MSAHHHHHHHHHYVAQRLSFDGALCTVRYIGPVAGTTGTWLGVEWDDPARGRHDGAHKDRRYFASLSRSPTAASFVRPTRPAERPRTFLEALHEKYAADSTAASPTRQIVISGKVAEEIGFDKIRRQQARLEELRIVILDGMRIDSVQTPASGDAEDGHKRPSVREVCPKVVELDLSRNLFTGLGVVVEICAQLSELRGLRLNGNRFQNVQQDLSLHHDASAAFQGVRELAVDETLLQWADVCHIASRFPSLTTLYNNANQLSTLSPIPTSWPPKTTLRSIYLEFNDFTSLTDVACLASLESLKNLYLKGNNISTLASSNTIQGDDAPSLPVFSKTLTYLDISYNKIHHWSFVDALPNIFPGLVSLRLAHNPAYDNPAFSSGTTTTTTSSSTTTAAGPSSSSSSTVTEEAYMITVARLAALKSLNFSAVTPTDRTNAEMFYLSRIGRQLASVPEQDEHKIIAQHPRYAALCELYGEPVVVRRKEVNPAFLEARLIGTTFRYLPVSGGEAKPGEAAENEDEKERERKVQIPKTFDIYAVKGIAGRLFGHAPLRLKLVWETGEWDPVAGFDDEAGDSDDEEEEEEEEEEEDALVQDEKRLSEVDNNNKHNRAGRWIKREVELTDSPRQFGFCVDGMDVTVRVEPR